MFKCFFSSKTFPKYLISYLILLIIPMLTATVIYFYTINNLEEQTKKNFRTVIENNISIIDRYYDELDRTVEQLAFNSRLNSFLAMNKLQEGSPAVMRVFNAQTAVKENGIDNYLIDYLFVYSKRSDIVITPNEAFMDDELFYRSFYNYKGVSITEWKEQVMSGSYNRQVLPKKEVILQGKQLTMLTYIQSLPLESPVKDKGYIVVMTDVNKINQLFNNAAIEGSWFYIQNSRGDLIASNLSDNRIERLGFNSSADSGSFTAAVDNEKFTICYVTSGRNSWIYVMGIPYRQLMKQVEYIRNVALVGILLLLLVEILISLLLAYKNLKPLKSLVTVFERTVCKNEIQSEESPLKALDELTFLSGSIQKLINMNVELEQASKEQNTLLRHIFIGRLLKGEFNSTEDIKHNINHVKMFLNGAGFTAVIVTVKGAIADQSTLKEIEKYKLTFKMVLEMMINNDNYLYDVNEKSLAFILEIPEHLLSQKEEYVKNFSLKTHELLQEYLGPIVRVSAGGIYNQLIDVQYSFSEAINLLNDASLDNEEVTVASLYPKEYSSYYYPLEYEQRIISIVNAGNKHELKKIMYLLFEKNFYSAASSSRFKKQLINDLFGTFIRISSDTEENNGIFQRILKGSDYQELFKMIEAAFYKLCENKEQAKRSHNDILIENIVAFIDKNYADLDMSLTCIADKFHITITYLSELKQTGENFSVYLSNIRLKNAWDMIESTDMTITDIALSVGYNSLASFRKAFKNKFGITPTDYRCSSRSTRLCTTKVLQ